MSQQQSRPKWWAVHGTTVVINALTERKGAKVGLITTEGFRDSLEVANDGATAVVTALWRDAESYERWTSRSDRGDLADGLSQLVKLEDGPATVGGSYRVALSAG